MYSGRWKGMLGARKHEAGLEIAEWERLVHPEDWPAVHLGLERHLSGETPFYEMEYRLRNCDGRYAWVLDQGRIIERCPDGSPRRMIGIDMDITERKRAETELRIAASVFESQEGVMVTDDREVILRVNQAFTKMSGYRCEDVIGQAPRLLKSGRHGREFYAAMWASIHDTGSWKGEIWNRRKSGEIYPEWLGITAIRDDGGRVTHYVATLHDITERKAAEQVIQDLAFYDALTALANRRLLLDRLGHARIVSERSGHLGALLFIDLDRFKELNDTLGHPMGDLLLQQVARRLTEAVRDVDTVARLGGDEFVVMLEDLSGEEEDARRQAEEIGAKILRRLTAPYQLAEHSYQSTPSIGVILFRGLEPTSEALIARADLAMYRAKQAGRNALCFFAPEMQESLDDRTALRDELRLGIGQEQFVLHYQPQMDREGRIRGVEALLRWANPRRDWILPNDFIPLAEESGLILPLGSWVLRQARALLTDWSREPDRRALTLSVNISVRQFRDPRFIEDLRELLWPSAFDPRRLRLELNSSLLLRDPSDLGERLAALKEMGVGLSLDNFGTGYSSLTELGDLAFDQLKLGLPLEPDPALDPRMTAIASSLIEVGHALGLDVLAAGVETEAQRDFLHARGCDAFQGYLFGQPLTREDLAERLGRSG